MEKLDVTSFKEQSTKGHLIIDTRPSEIFAEGFIKNSVSLPFSDNFLNALTDIAEDDQQILFVTTDENAVKLDRLVKGSGNFKAIGYLDGGFDAWKNAGNKTDMIIGIDEEEFAIDYQFDEFFLVDLRSPEEFAKEHAEDAENVPMVELEQVLTELDLEQSYYLYANTPEEAITAASIFKKNGFQRVRPLAAGYEKLRATKIPFFVQKKKDKNAPKFPHQGPSND